MGTQMRSSETAGGARRYGELQLQLCSRVWLMRRFVLWGGGWEGWEGGGGEEAKAVHVGRRTGVNGVGSGPGLVPQLLVQQEVRALILSV